MTLMRPIQCAARDHDRRLQTQLGALLGSDWSITSSRSRDWASATFTGARHSLLLCAPHVVSEEEIKALTKRIASYEFTLARAFVNDATLARCKATPTGHSRIVIELLVIEDR